MVAVTFLTAFLVSVIVRVVLGGFIVMLAAGMVHIQVLPQVPAFSFKQSMVLAIALTVVGSFFYQPQSSSSS